MGKNNLLAEVTLKHKQNQHTSEEILFQLVIILQ